MDQGIKEPGDGEAIKSYTGLGSGLIAFGLLLGWLTSSEIWAGIAFWAGVLILWVSYAEGKRPEKEAQKAVQEAVGRKETARRLNDHLQILPGHVLRTLALRCGVMIPRAMGTDFRFELVRRLERRGDDAWIVRIPELNKQREFAVVVEEKSLGEGISRKSVKTFLPGTTEQEIQDYFDRYEKLDIELKDDQTISYKDLRQIYLDRHAG